ncbi:MAG: isoleucine--tRNA ligase [Clostridia bacterium]|nr:isoleucine--tRNA ligase [Clostridia bacterium]
MYNKVDNNLDFIRDEQKTLAFWKENKIFEQTMEKNKGRKIFSFYEGPPTANGKPHIGHPLTRAMKDIIPRFKTMQGYYVPRKAGWDTHGLPVEVEVEKNHGFSSKGDIVNYGVDKFIEDCKESVWKYKSIWEDMTDRFGYFIDTDKPYITYDNNYIESVFWALKTMHEKGLIYKGHKIVPYCPRCGTALSKSEAEQEGAYKTLNEKTVYVKFKSEQEENTYFLVWTTTPWTLPSNTALCMNPEEIYSKIKAEDGSNYIMLKALIPTLFEDGTYTVVYEKKGKEFLYHKYYPMFSYCLNEVKSGYFVVCDDYVTTEDGTGIVHIAPAFGQDDYNVGLKYGLSFIQLIGEDGKFDSRATDFAGLGAKQSDPKVIEKLKETNALFKVQMHEHNYPHCWRCHTPLLYYAQDAWFIKTTAVKEKMLENSNGVYWIPETIKTGRMGNFLKNNIDWGISRTRFWGTPLPFWVCDCGHIHAIGSVSELKELTGASGDLDLHKPTLDKLTIKCPKCGKDMHRTPEVLDCWFDSGSMPFAQYHYPFENKEWFEKTFPADFICEGIDQTRGWFYSLLAISTILFGKSPYRSCTALGLVNDKFGRKMSKSLGNGVDPYTILNKEGADALRWYFYNNATPGTSLNFNEENLLELQRKFMGTLHNSYAFYILYAEIDKFNPSKYENKDLKLSLLDKWLLSEYNSLVEYVTNCLEKYDMLSSSRKITEFVDNLSNWYIRRSRERFWASGEGEDKIAAFKTLYDVLSGLVKLIAPFVPFISENIYQNLVRSVDKNAPISVHLCSYPVADKSKIDKTLNEGMEEVLNVVALGRSVRNAQNLKARQPLSKCYVCYAGKTHLNKDLTDLIKGELNVLGVEQIKEAYEYVNYSLKPNLPVLGPKYGKLIGEIRKVLASANAAEVVKGVKSGKPYEIKVGDITINLTEADLFIEVLNKDGYASESNGQVTVILDTTITEELAEMGMVREIVSKIQNLRKDSGLEVTDHINLAFSGSESLVAVALKNAKTIEKETLAKIVSGKTLENKTILEMNENQLEITLQKI